MADRRWIAFETVEVKASIIYTRMIMSECPVAGTNGGLNPDSWPAGDIVWRNRLYRRIADVIFCVMWSVVRRKNHELAKGHALPARGA